MDSQTESFGIVPKVNNGPSKENTREKLMELVEDFKKNNTNKDHFFYPVLEYGFLYLQ